MTVSKTLGSLTRALDAASGGECNPKRFKADFSGDATDFGFTGMLKKVVATRYAFSVTLDRKQRASPGSHSAVSLPAESKTASCSRNRGRSPARLVRSGPTQMSLAGRPSYEPHDKETHKFRFMKKI